MSPEGYNGAAYLEEPQDVETILHETLHIVELKGSSERIEPLPYQRVAFQGIHRALQNDEYLDLIREAMFLNKPESTISPLYVAQRLVRVSHTVAWQRGGSRYPFSHSNAQAWDRTHKAMLDVERTDYEELYGRAWQYMGRDIMTNKAERGNMIQLVAALHGKTNKPLTILEFGSSMNHILHALRLAEKGDYTFGDMTVAKRVDGQQEIAPSYDIVDDSQLSALVTDLVQKRPLKLKQAIGVDIANPEDVGTKRWVRGCSHYVDEVQDKKLLRQFNRLSQAASAMVRSVYPVDISRAIDPAVIQERVPNFSGQADITFMSFSWYELKDHQGPQTAVANAIKLTKEDGLVVIYDAVDIDENSGEPTFHDPRRPWKCAVYVYDKQRPDLGFQKYFSTKNGRGTHLILEPVAMNRLNTDGNTATT